MNTIGKCAVGPALGRPGYVDCTCAECTGGAVEHDSSDPDCVCVECGHWRRLRIQAKCAQIAAVHWAFAPSDNDGDDEMGAWVGALLVRASMIRGVAPWAPGPDDALTMGADYEEIAGMESGVRKLPAESDASQRPTSRPPAMPKLRSA